MQTVGSNAVIETVSGSSNDALQRRLDRQGRLDPQSHQRHRVDARGYRGQCRHHRGQRRTTSATTLALDGATITGPGKLSTSGASALIETVSGTTDAIKGGTLLAGSLLEVVSASTLTLSGGTLDTGAIVQAASGGTAIVSGTVTNGGTLFASGAGSLIDIVGIANGGIVEVGDGIVEIAGSGSESIRFVSGTGGLEIADTQAHTSAFAARISGFGGLVHTNSSQVIDLISVTSAGGITSSYVSANLANTSGTLFVSSGGHLVAAIKFVGAYSAGNFHITSGVSGTVAIIDPTVPNGGSAEVGAPARFPQQASICQHRLWRTDHTRLCGNQPAPAAPDGERRTPRRWHCAPWQLHGRKLRHRRRRPWRYADHGNAADRAAAAVGASARVMIVVLRRWRGLHRRGHLRPWHVRRCGVRTRYFGLHQQV